MTQKKRLDKLRAMAAAVLLLGIIYFYLDLFFPYFIPTVLKFGIIDRPLNVLVLGTDITFDIQSKRESFDTGRTDAIMLMHFSQLSSRANLISVPRDSYVEIPGYGYNKINAAYVLGGIDLTQKTLEKLLGIGIDKHVIVNTKGIAKLVDLLGGVWIDVDKDIYYIDKAQYLRIDLKAGRQKLLGHDAEGFIRFRHDALGDLGRIERQQQFLSSLAKSLATPGAILKAPFIIGIIRDHVRSNFSLKEFIMLANSMRMMPARNIKSQTLQGEPGNNEAGSVILLNSAEIKKIIEQNF